MKSITLRQRITDLIRLGVDNLGATHYYKMPRGRKLARLTGPGMVKYAPDYKNARRLPSGAIIYPPIRLSPRKQKEGATWVLDPKCVAEVEARL